MVCLYFCKQNSISEIRPFLNHSWYLKGLPFDGYQLWLRDLISVGSGPLSIVGTLSRTLFLLKGVGIGGHVFSCLEVPFDKGERTYPSYEERP